MSFVKEIQNNITVSNTTETPLLTGVSNKYVDLTMVLVNNTSATAARVDFRDTTAGTVRFSLYVEGGKIAGFSLPNSWKSQAAGGNWTVQASASVTDLRIAAQGVVRT